ncbi:hypothetical protein ncot_13985 [Nocardioides sp. JQ2195]|uniref:hypothetical protein n=1 Tax=Nocardioides sp. JQ2195 TaxID=2592334 RepID=UPI00143E76F7|nr:hypothetical protein [Nocardioides sp. JQ2195]QIX27588.1 hypothetical protein ncot_13985 [Nocardioides sp. JQ2195]
MNVTTTALTKAAGIAAATAGVIFIAVQINHPATDAYLTETNEWVMRCSAKGVMAALALAGITGIYLSQARKMRALGLVGFVTFAAGYLTMFATQMMAVFFLPALTDKSPRFVADVIVAADGGKPTGDIGHIQVLFNITGACYMLGGLMFGIALFRAGVLARWASALLAVATVGTASLAVLPEAFNRPMAVPTGIALIGLGVSLWRTTLQGTTKSATPGVSTQVAASR